jgi:hypothetical protein
MSRSLWLATLLVLSSGLLGGSCEEHEAVPLEELRRDIAPPFDYGLYCDDHGRLVGERSAVLLVYRAAHLEQVYADSQTGNPRAQALFQQLEEVSRATGARLAEQALGMACQSAPACTVQWRSLDEMMPSRQPGGMRLRELMAGSFSRQAKLVGVKNAVSTAALDVLLAGTLLRPGAPGTVEARAGTTEFKASTAEAGQLAREALLERRLALPAGEGRLASAEVAVLEVRLAEAEALEAGARHPVRLEALAEHRPIRGQPPRAVSVDNERWAAYVTYWEQRYAELAGARPRGASLSSIPSATSNTTSRART